MLTQVQMQQSFQDAEKTPITINIIVKDGKVTSGSCKSFVAGVGFEFHLAEFETEPLVKKPAYLFHKNSEKKGVYTPIMDEDGFTKENIMSKMIFEIIRSNESYAFKINISENGKERGVDYTEMCEIFNGGSSQATTSPTHNPSGKPQAKTQQNR